jgi:c-di-GMP-related signal transduction protein
MQREEFDQRMIAKFGWTFPVEYYESIIEPVYMMLNEDKDAFVDFCGEKDLNGLETLLHAKHYVMDLVETGMSVNQVLYVVRRFNQKDSAIKSVRAHYDDAIKAATQICFEAMRD